jgi:hypothetical protein
MNILWRCKWTEYERDESGAWDRPDGYTYANMYEDLQTEIKRQEACGDEDCYSRASDITQVIVSDELYFRVSTTPNLGCINTGKIQEGDLGKFTPNT